MTRMKESGIDWIGQIPEEWELGRVKDFYKFFTGFTPDTSRVEYYGDINDFVWVTIADMTSKKIESSKQTLSDIFIKEKRPQVSRLGSLLYSFKLSVGKVAFANTDLYTNEAIATFEDGPNINLRFLYYSSYLIEFNSETNIYGAKLLNSDRIRNACIVQPSLSEQTKIADFLDKETAQLDKAKALLEEQIQKLKDYRASLIYETVTKGLDKTVPMKDSGIDWIGQIPEGWGVSRLKYYFDIYAGGDIDERNTVEEYSESHPYPVLSNSLENEGVLGYTNKYRFKKNCVTVTGRGDVGKAVYRNINFYPVVRLLVCVPKSQVDCRFVTYWINSAIIEKNQTAVSQLTIQMLGELLFVNVPFLVQKNIADFLDKETIQIDKLIQIKNQQIDNINKQRQTLIYDYVTGKRRV